MRWFQCVALGALILTAGTAYTAPNVPRASCLTELIHEIFQGQWKKEVPLSVLESLKRRSEWNTARFTNPREWDNANPPKRFRFLVRMIFNYHGNWETRFQSELLHKINGINRNSEDRILSSSLISDDETRFPMGPGLGVILKTDGSHVYATFPRDARTSTKRWEWGFSNLGDATFHREREYATALLETQGIFGPNELLKKQKTALDQYPWNEVVLFDDPAQKGERLSVQGILQVMDRRYPPAYFPKLKAFANELDLPLVIVQKDRQ